MYVCERCTEKHQLNSRLPTTANGVCEICYERGFLAWTDDLFRVFGDERPTVGEQLDLLAAKRGMTP